MLIAGEVMGTRPAYRRESSMVFQDYALFPHMSVLENVGFGPHGAAREPGGDQAQGRRHAGGRRVDRVRRPPAEPALGASSNASPSPARWCWSRRLLLLDEPLGALDLKMRRHMQVELKNLQHRVGVTFIYVTHDQEEALVMSIESR